MLQKLTIKLKRFSDMLATTLIEEISKWARGKWGDQENLITDSHPALIHDNLGGNFKKELGSQSPDLKLL